MTTTRLVLRTSAIVSAVIAVQTVILYLYGYGFNVVAALTTDGAEALGGAGTAQQIIGYFVELVVHVVIDAAAFGAGIFVALRFVRRIESSLTWRQVGLRAILAAAFGSVAVFLARLIETLLATINIGPYPLGYSFTTTVNSNGVQEGLFNSFGGLLSPFINYAPLVVLACVFLKLWLTARPESTESKVRASASA